MRRWPVRNDKWNDFGLAKCQSKYRFKLCFYADLVWPNSYLGWNQSTRAEKQGRYKVDPVSWFYRETATLLEPISLQLTWLLKTKSLSGEATLSYFIAYEDSFSIVTKVQHNMNQWWLFFLLNLTKTLAKTFSCF